MHLFRGLSNVDYVLEPTLDRGRQWINDDLRSEAASVYLEEFKTEAIRLAGERDLPEGLALELLARHSGLPSQLLDWSESPYVAAYFAYSGAIGKKVKEIAIWNLIRAQLPDSFPEEDLIIDVTQIRFNPRARQQRGAFLRVAKTDPPIENQLGNALRKFVLPADEARDVVAELDEMMVNATNLYYDLSGAAETARYRVDGWRQTQ